MDVSVTRPRPRTALKVALLAFAQLIIAIDYNIVYVALPQIGRELDFSAQSLQWVVSAYAVTFGGFLLLCGQLVDRLGPRRMFILALLAFAVASLVGGVASDPLLLVAARGVQGLGGAMLFPATLTLINTSFAEGPERNRAMGVWGTASACGVFLGASVGGLLTSYLGWEWVFFVNVPLALGAALVAPRLLTADAPTAVARGGFDVPGAIIATLGSTLLVFSLVSGPEVGWRSVRGAGCLVLGTALLGLFVLVEKRSSSPLMPLRMLRNRGLATAMALVFVFMGNVSAMHYMFFIYLQNVLDYGALAAGLAFLPISLLGVPSSSKMLPALIKHWGLRTTLLIGMLGVSLAMATLAAGISVDGSYWALMPSLVIWGVFVGMTFPAIFLVAGSRLPADEQGVGSALASTCLQIGSAVGLAALIAVANAGSAAGSDGAAVTSATVDGLRMTGWVGAAAAAASALIALVLGKPEPEPETADAVPVSRS